MCGLAAWLGMLNGLFTGPSLISLATVDGVHRRSFGVEVTRKSESLLPGANLIKEENYYQKNERMIAKNFLKLCLVY